MIKHLAIGLLLVLAAASVRTASVGAEERPNILFCIADDWGWPHAGAYGDQAVKTPAFDRLAREGLLFQQAFVSSPSCTPSRNAILTGQWHWRLKEGANLHSNLPASLPVYPHLLEEKGYFIGHTNKSYGPGKLDHWPKHPAGERWKDFKNFLFNKPQDKPFCFWLGSSDPHRPYEEGSGKESGIDLSQVHLFKHFPDDEVVRSDVADYYFEVQRFDALIALAIEALEEAKQLENTIIVVTGDHGMPFPRGKGNLYDSGAHVPLAIRWGKGIKQPGRKIDDLVSLTDLAPTFLAVAGVAIPEVMTGRSLTNVFQSEQSGKIDPARGEVYFGKERHTPCQEAPQSGGYPCRAIRTHQYLYIRNFDPQRWPVGTPHHERAYQFKAGRGWLGDTDNGPTKSYIAANKDFDEAHRTAYELSFGKRPAEELYDLTKDPEQLKNVIDDSAYAQVKVDLSKRLTEKLRETGDPRVTGGGEAFDTYPYHGGVPEFVGDKQLEKYRKQK